MIKPSATTALLLIDVQKGFDDRVWGPRNNPEAEANIARLLDFWRQAHAPVIHVFHDSLTLGRPLHPDSPGNAPKPEALPRPDELQFRKNVNSAFIGTALEAHLRACGIEAIVVAGLTTNHCVSTTVRMASNLGFKVTVVADATAAFDGVMVDGRHRPAQEVHDAALSDLHGEFALVAEVATIFGAHAPDTSADDLGGG